MLYFLKFLKPFYWQIFLIFVLTFLQAYTSLQAPKIIAEAINDGILKSDFNAILFNTLRLAFFTISSFALFILGDYILTRIVPKIFANIQMDIISKVLTFSKSDLNHFGVSSLITRSISDAKRIRVFLDELFSRYLFAIIAVVWIIVEVVQLAPEMSWIVIVAATAASIFSPILAFIVIPLIKQYYKFMDKFTGVLRQNIAGVRVIRAFDGEKTERRRFDSINNNIVKKTLQIDYVLAAEGPFIGFTYDVIAALCIFVGISMLKIDINYLGVLTAFLGYVIRIIGHFLTISYSIALFSRTSIAAKRIKEVLTRKNNVKWLAHTFGAPDQLSEIKFNKVNFRFHDAEEDLLRDISFTAKPGETTAFIGPTGCGKTTLAELMLRMHDVTSGEITIGGINIKNYSKADLMRRIGYVPQKSMLFSGTIAENIKFSTNNASDEEMRQAAEIAMVADHINSLPEKYGSQISQAGKNLSGGQKQRISIARALVKKPEILIFDDAFSALDMHTDAKLREALKPISRDIVNIIIAQRINTIKDAEQIIVLDKGKIVGRGRHYELLRNCKVYRDIAKSQYHADEIEKELQIAEEWHA